MRTAFKTLLPAAVLAFGLGITGAAAAPAGAGLNAAKTANEAASLVEQARFVRKCTRVGHRWRKRTVCRTVWVGPRRHRYWHNARPHKREYVRRPSYRRSYR
ncbi:MAG: hypothetical protein R3D67_21510 [Hyphomicrobiaceae bacterium]